MLYLTTTSSLSNMLKAVHISPKVERFMTIALSFEFFLNTMDVFFVYILFLKKIMFTNLQTFFF